MAKLTHLARLEAESIHIFREVAAEFAKPLLMYSIGKDSSVLLHLARKAFFPGRIPFPLLHIDTGWKFKEMISFRDETAKRLNAELIVHTNEAGKAAGVTPFTHGARYTDIMKTEALKQALDKYGCDAAIGGARRDEEKSRAKERVFSFRDAQHRWDPKNQRPELWNLYNGRLRRGDSIRVFPLSNWTEVDIWTYIHTENIPVVPLYFAKPRPIVDRDGLKIMVDDDRLPLNAGREAAPRDHSLPFARLLSTHRRAGVQGRQRPGDHRRDAAHHDFRAPEPRHRRGFRRGDGKSQARRLLLMAAVPVKPAAPTTRRSRLARWSSSSRSSARSTCCVSSPAARSTTARAR